MDDTDEQEDQDMIDSVPLPASGPHVADNVRSDTPIVQGVFSRKIVAKASKNVRQLKHLNDNEVSGSGEDALEKDRMHRTNFRKNSLSRVAVSSRFDVLVSNNLFKKHLGQNHEDILERIYKQRGGVFSSGMRKAYSNIDLTTIDLSQTFNNPLSNNGKSASFSTADKQNENQGSQGLHQGHSKDTGQQRRRRVSISSGQEVQGIVDELSGMRKQVTINGQRTQTVTAISSRGKRQKFNVPSFSEFRKQRQMRIASGHQYAKEAKSLLDNNQSVVHLPEVSSQSLAEASVLITAMSSENSDQADQLQPINEDEQKRSRNVVEHVEGKSQEAVVVQSEHVGSCAVGNGEMVIETKDSPSDQMELKQATDVSREKGEILSLEQCSSGEGTPNISDSSKEVHSVTSLNQGTKNEGELTDVSLPTNLDSNPTCMSSQHNSGEITIVPVPSEEEKTPSVSSQHNSGEVTIVSDPAEEERTPSVSNQHNSGEITIVPVPPEEEKTLSVTPSVSNQNNSGEVTIVSVPAEEERTPSVSCQHNSGEVTIVSVPAEEERTPSVSSQHNSGEVTIVSVPAEEKRTPSVSSQHNSGEVTSAIPTERTSDSNIPKDVVLALMGSSMETQMSDEVFDDDDSELQSSKKPPIHICLQGNTSEKSNFVRHDLDLNESDMLVLEDLDVPTANQMCNIDTTYEPLSLPNSMKDACETLTFNSLEHETSVLNNNFITLEVPSESNTDDIDLSDTRSQCDRDCGLLPGKKITDVVKSLSETVNSETCVPETSEPGNVPEKQDSLDNCPEGGNGSEVLASEVNNDQQTNSTGEISERGNQHRTETTYCTKSLSPEKPKILPRTPKNQAKPDIAPRPVPRSRPVNDPSRSQVVQTGIRPRKRKLPTRPPRVSRRKSETCNLKTLVTENSPALQTSRSLDSEELSQVKGIVSEVIKSSPGMNDIENSETSTFPPPTDASTPPLPSSPPPTDLPTPPLPSNPPPTLLKLSDRESPLLYVQSDDSKEPINSLVMKSFDEKIPFLPESLNETGPFNVLHLPTSDNNSPSDDGTFYFPENPKQFSSLVSADVQCEESIFVFPEPMLNSPLSDQEEPTTPGSVNQSDQTFLSTSESVTSDTSNKPASWLPSSTDDIYKSCDSVHQQPESETDFDLSGTTFDPTKNLNVYRSSSDVSNSTPEALQKRRERKERPYKSDPFAGGKRPSPGQFIRRQRGLPSDDGFTEDWIDEMDEAEAVTLAETEADRKRRIRMSVISDASTDSGVIGQDGQDGLQEAPPSPTGSSGSYGFTTKGGDKSGFSIMDPNRDEENVETSITVGNKEAKKTERKDIIIEIRDTEKSYGRDLHILKDHFYKPMKTNGLLSSDQVEAIFLNLEQLINTNAQFTARLDTALQDAVTNGDHGFVTISIGNLFLKSTDLMMAFESYCVNQSHAGNLLEQLEKEKELLRIFLQASQDDNGALRRMPLKSFLILPVQRIMRYPLLLERLHKYTSCENPDKEAISLAKAKLEEILAHINAKTQKSSGSMKMKKKVADLLLQRQAHSMEKAELNRAAIDILGWNKKDVCDITTCRLQVALATDHNWATKRLRLKFSTVQGILLTLGKGERHRSEEDGLLFPRKTQVIQAAVVLLKEKNGKYQTLREPFMLNRCIVNHDPDSDDMFEVFENNKEPFVFKGDDNEVKPWLMNMKQQTLDLGTWRKRRNALPNIMIKHLV
ncbi:mucin-17-like [Ylistrum balloti]|uniref:mucin-17-like n=1 Tax=Ylistrum balloti TaxID=509963 RepID=UPI0029059F21|nr:mucin-17-like [Ylistrum balloti]